LATPSSHWRSRKRVGVLAVKKEFSVAEKIEKRQQSNAIQKFWRETEGELRKVTWPTTQEAWYLTRIVLLVLFAMAAIMGLLDFVFSKVITAILA
jgi:preprotein translocase subunit SecE